MTLAFRDMSISAFLGDLCRALQSEWMQESGPMAVTTVSVEDVEAIFETILSGRAKINPQRPATKYFVGWALDRRGCGKLDRVDCAVFDALLGHETVARARFAERSMRGSMDHF